MDKKTKDETCSVCGKPFTMKRATWYTYRWKKQPFFCPECAAAKMLDATNKYWNTPGVKHARGQQTAFLYDTMTFAERQAEMKRRRAGVVKVKKPRNLSHIAVLAQQAKEKWAKATPEERAAHGAKIKSSWDAKSEAEKKAISVELRQVWDSRTPENKASMRAQWRTWWEALPEEEKQKIHQKISKSIRSSKSYQVAIPGRTKKIREYWKNLSPTERYAHKLATSAGRARLSQEARDRIAANISKAWRSKTEEELDMTRARHTAWWKKRTPEELHQLRIKNVKGNHAHGEDKLNLPEFEIQQFLNKLGFNFHPVHKWILGPNRTTNKEPLSYKDLDLLDTEKSVAIEFHGLRDHSVWSRNPCHQDYHLNKLLSCGDPTLNRSEKVIRLVQIFEHEWRDRKAQVKSRLKSILGVFDRRIGASKCKLEEVSTKEANAFLDENHLQGRCLFHLAVGLRYKGELLAVMTFSRHHRNQKSPVTVLSRLCYKAGVSVPFGAIRMLVNAKKKLPNIPILSWSDNRWSEGGVYREMGFDKVDELPPDYFYLHENYRTVESKQSCSKEKLRAKGGVGDTEAEMAKAMGKLRIYDAGKRAWRLEAEPVAETPTVTVTFRSRRQGKTLEQALQQIR